VAQVLAAYDDERHWLPRRRQHVGHLFSPLLGAN